MRAYCFEHKKGKGKGYKPNYEKHDGKKGKNMNCFNCGKSNYDNVALLMIALSQR